MSTSMPEAILFDLDGTLVDTAPDLAEATNALRRHHGLAPLPYGQIRGQVSNGGSALVTLAIGLESGSTEHDTARQYLLDNYEQAVAVHSRLFEPLDQWLTRWHSESRLWGIVTNKPRRYTLPLLEALALTPGALLCADDLAVKKPAPEPLWEAARRLNVAPQTCWYVGDHIRDIEAAKAAGMTAVAVGYGYISEEDDYQQWPADLWFETCQDLVDALTAFHR
ncbi:HAD-IA family hydrolase [Halomonas sp. TD01]|uniref:HAD-IA family hydrolase n=1 Tax=Halomonas sp. TD01 TaxID=999141 RepID=UPI000214E10B|nr:HAD-IA family hydrolase [Halomonas sp. TD01]EGP18471.1 phosphoglycolate phosphatase [Halomonas sp. TD01]CAH1044631.1 Similar to phosphoglycolate phosphatase, clustered with ubiquinone biosynthesis SAM-dependent O-methyltransferase [Halomonas sp. TD01]